MIKKQNIQAASFGSGTKKRLDRETENELREAFDLFDPNKEDRIDARELKAIMQAFGIDVKKEDIRNIYRELAKDINDPLGFAEFVQIIEPRLVKKII